MPAPEMPTSASLSSLASRVEDLVEQVTAGARASDGAGTEAVSAALYDTERSLRAARRSLEAARRHLG